MSASTKNVHAFAAVLTLEEPAVLEIKEIQRPLPRPTFEFHEIPELDGLRGAAILCVIIGHFLQFRGGSIEIRGIAGSVAQTGVLLFFVLSGFLITGVLSRERSATGRVHLKDFYLRRVLRLGPALLLFLATAILLMSLGLITDVPKKELLECLFYARNFFGRSLSLSHIWSLSLEEQFYLVWPLTFSLLPMRRSAVMVSATCIVLAAWRGAAISARLFSYEAGVYYMRPYFRFDSILIGAAVVLWLVSSQRAEEKLRNALSMIPWMVLWAALGVWTAMGESLSRSMYLTIQELLCAAALAQVVLCNQTRLAAFFRSRWLRYLGAISYSLYLWQQLFVVTYTPSWGLLRELPLSVILPVAIAIVSYHIIEKPFLRLKDKLAPQTLSRRLRD